MVSFPRSLDLVQLADHLDRAEFKLGAINELWISSMEELSPLYLDVYDLHLRAGAREPPSGAAKSLPDGLQMLPARLQDVEAVRSLLPLLTLAI